MIEIIAKQDQREMLIYAFRYALGRQSYAVQTVGDCIKSALIHMADSDKGLYEREIEFAIARGRAGSEMDVAQWRSVLSAIKKSLEQTVVT